MKKATVKKSLILVVALIVCMAVLLAACSEKPFAPVTAPTQAEVSSNYGLAVKYGEWLYYINGYTSDVNAVNTYTDDVKDAPRVGSVVRIKLSDIGKLFDIQDETNKTSSEKSDEVAQYVREHAETVVPNIYYNANTDSSTVNYNGLYIFNNRLYITTPNDELTAGGDKQTSQLVLTSFKLDGSAPQRHFVFSNNTVQLVYTEKDSKLFATYVMDSKVYNLDVAAGTSVPATVNGTDEASDVENVYNSVTWDISGKCLFFIDKFYGICKLSFGSDKYDVIVKNSTYELHEHDGSKSVEAGNVSYTISSVNNGQVYYTKADSQNSSVDSKVLYWASSADNADSVALSTSLSGSKAWKDGRVVYSKSITSEGSTYYGIYVVSQDSNGVKTQVILDPPYNDSSVTIDRIEGDTLYYTSNSVGYKLNIADAYQKSQANEVLVEGTPYVKSLPSAAGWAAADFVDDGNTHYVISATTGGTLSVSKFDPSDRNKTQVSVSILLTPVPEETEE